MYENAITAKQIRVIGLLLTCPSRSAAIQEAGIAATTLYRWFQNPAFLAEYQRAAGQYLDENIGQLQTQTGKALQTIIAIMNDKKAAASVRLSAARTIYEFAFKAKDLAVTEKIDELEKLIKRQEDGEEFRSYEND